jgi:Tol biopolymer transport system component
MMAPELVGRRTVDYFDSDRTGEPQVWKIPEAGGDAIQVTRDGGLAPVESPDRRFIYYTKALYEMQDRRSSAWAFLHRR